MFRSIVIAATTASLAVMAVPAPAAAQTALGGLSSCDPTTGLGPNGRPCVALKRIAPSAGAAPAGVARPEGVRVLDPSTLGETFECQTLGNGNTGTGSGEVVALIEECGEPLVITNTQPYWPGDIAVASPPPPPPPPAAAPVALPSAGPVYAPVQATGLANKLGPLALGAVGLAAVVGIAIAADDDDDSTSTTTTGTN